MTHALRHWIDRLDRFAPAAALALVLLFQGMVSTGAAAGLMTPGLVGPDGQLLSYNDICNNSGENAEASSHCGGCILEHAGLLPGLTAGPPAFSEYAATTLRPIEPATISRPEAEHILRTGPPHA